MCAFFPQCISSCDGNLWVRMNMLYLCFDHLYRIERWVVVLFAIHVLYEVHRINACIRWWISIWSYEQKWLTIFLKWVCLAGNSSFISSFNVYILCHWSCTLFFFYVWKRATEAVKRNALNIHIRILSNTAVPTWWWGGKYWKGDGRKKNLLLPQLILDMHLCKLNACVNYGEKIVYSTTRCDCDFNVTECTQIMVQKIISIYLIPMDCRSKHTINYTLFDWISIVALHITLIWWRQKMQRSHWVDWLAVRKFCSYSEPLFPNGICIKSFMYVHVHIQKSIPSIFNYFLSNWYRTE